jgi:hypothetical protein
LAMVRRMTFLRELAMGVVRRAGGGACGIVAQRLEAATKKVQES